MAIFYPSDFMPGKVMGSCFLHPFKIGREREGWELEVSRTLYFGDLED